MRRYIYWDLLFRDRTDAGRRLAEALMKYRGKDAVVLAIPRGGVVVGYEVALALDADLDVVVARKLGAPYNPELAIGAVAYDGTLVLNYDVICSLGVPDAYIEEEKKRQVKEMKRRLRVYRGDKPLPDVRGRIAILVDDGIATGATMLACVKAVKNQGASCVIVAVPVGPPEAVRKLAEEADEVVCISQPSLFFAIGQFYADFRQVTDDEVLDLLNRAASRRAP